MQEIKKEIVQTQSNYDKLQTELDTYKKKSEERDKEIQTSRTRMRAIIRVPR